MLQIPDIIRIVNNSAGESLQLVHEKKQAIPSAVQFNIKRFNKGTAIKFEDGGMVVYSNNNQPREKYLQLKFCVAGNTYCDDASCKNCMLGHFKNCSESADSLDVVQIHFTPAQLSQFIKSKTNNSLSDEVLNFRHQASFSKTLPVCPKIKGIIEGLVNHQYEGSLENIYVNAQLHMLLLLSLGCLSDDEEPTLPECKFLNNVSDKSKVAQAKDLLMQHIGEPITIKELSRKVAMNECYLKKGFKEMYGTTIFDFYQNQRMEHAKYLLYEKSMSVTDVAMILGYSSISHFSTAFKKQTGLKPCELLLR